jgi:hypothetical protein
LAPALGAALETFDIALLGTCVAVLLSLPLAVLAAENVTPSRLCYVAARGVIAVTRAVPRPGICAPVRHGRRARTFPGRAGGLGALDRDAWPLVRRDH